jgi:DNA replication protein
MTDRQLLSPQGKTGFVRLPDSFFTNVIPKIQDLVELKVVLYMAHIILRKQQPGISDSERSITYSELKAEIHRLSPDLSEETLHQALDSAAEHGALSRSTSNINEVLEDVYSLTADSGQPPAINIFALYEQNIGIITPMIAEKLKDADSTYPLQWIEEAIEIAVTLNKRNWGYIARILERWATEGKDSGEHKRNAKKDDPDKYIKGKYGHLVKR